VIHTSPLFNILVSISSTFLRTNVSYKCRFSSFYYVHATRKSCLICVLLFSIFGEGEKCKQIHLFVGKNVGFKLVLWILKNWRKYIFNFKIFERICYEQDKMDKIDEKNLTIRADFFFKMQILSIFVILIRYV